jgi:4a-hydroxytetrahydrobiopterin dehydratase
MNRPRKLSAGDIAIQLARLPEWRQHADTIVRELRFPAYLAGVDFAVAVAHAAEAMNHHPDLTIGWRKLTITLSTHDAGGLTELDFALAAQIEALVDQARA